MISLQPVFGNVCRLMTRYWYKELAFKVLRDSTLNFKFPIEPINDLKSWLIHVRKYNDKKLHVAVTERESALVYSDLAL